MPRKFSRISPRSSRKPEANLSPAAPSILLSRPDRVGDVIIATACLPLLRQQRPGERLVFVAREVMRPLLEEHPLLDGFIALPPTPRSSRQFFTGIDSLAEIFRREQATDLVHLHPDRICQLAGWRAGVPRRLGYRSSLLMDWTLTESREDQRQQGRQHEAQYTLDLLAALGVEPSSSTELKPNIHLAARWQESLHNKLAASGRIEAGKYIVLNPTAYSLTHRWPPEKFAWLAHQLRPYTNRFIIIGEPAGDPGIVALRSLLGDLSDGWIDMSGSLNLAELGWLLRGAALLVSRNTGTTHLAAGVDCPVVELFGRLESPYGPVRWGAISDKVTPVFSPARIRRRFESKQAFWIRGFGSISREDVLAAALQLLKQNSPTS